MNFTYVVSKPPDMTFGALKPDGNWTGMIGELVYQNADIGKVFKRYKLLQLESKVAVFSFCFKLWLQTMVFNHNSYQELIIKSCFGNACNR